MRITFLLPRYGWEPSGGFAVVYTYAGLLAGRGHDVTVVHPRRLPPGGWPSPEGLFARLHYMGGRLRDRFFKPRLRWARPDPRVRLTWVPDISDSHVPDGDAVIATWWSTAEAALELPASKGVRFHLVQGYETWNGAEERVHASWRAPLHKIVIAGWMMERALELGVQPALLTHVPIAVALDVFRVEQPIETRPRQVAMLYSKEFYKGGDLGVEILRRVRRTVPDVSAVLFGVGPRPRGLPPWMRYIRRATQRELAADVYNASAVYLCPSLSEGWHLPPAEAMACGCAVAASDIGGVRDYARHDDTALLFEAGNVDAGAEQVCALLLDDRRRTRIAQQGLETIRGFSWQASVEKLDALIASRVRSASALP